MNIKQLIERWRCSFPPGPGVIYGHLVGVWGLVICHVAELGLGRSECDWDAGPRLSFGFKWLWQSTVMSVPSVEPGRGKTCHGVRVWHAPRVANPLCHDGCVCAPFECSFSIEKHKKASHPYPLRKKGAI